MNNYNKLNHTTWDCKYHLIWIPKYRKKLIYANLRRNLGEVLKELALQKESNIINRCPDFYFCMMRKVK
ncbi:MAG: transposase [Desulfobacterales bacterium]|nr:transposase [Desulfobacterales bacterium]